MMIILNTDKLLEIFVFSDDFMKEFQPYIKHKLIGPKKWRGKMSKSEMMSIMIFFHLSGVRCFRWYYEMIVKQHLQQDFPYLCTYENFVSHMPATQLELFAFLHYFCLSQPTEANYIDSKLKGELKQQGCQLITKLRANMKKIFNLRILYFYKNSPNKSR